MAVSPPHYSELPPPETVFLESFVSPNGAWNILHMIRNSNKMNNKYPNQLELFTRLNENPEAHPCLIKANIWRCQWQMPNYAEPGTWPGVIWNSIALLSFACCCCCCCSRQPASPSKAQSWPREYWEQLFIHPPASQMPTVIALHLRARKLAKYIFSFTFHFKQIAYFL